MTSPVAVVAGAGPGLGRALAQRFAQAGLRVARRARDPGRVQALAAAVGPDTLPIACDLAEPVAVSAAFARIDRELGPAQCVIFNAGTFRPGGILEVSAQDFHDCWKIGCFA